MLYTEWVDRIQQILAPVLESRSNKQNGRWYLRPDEKALSSDEMADLFGAVQSWWFTGLSKPYSPGALRKRLQEARPPETLPLLYCMSYVARTWGRGGEYWPQFCEHVLSGKLQPEIIYAVASDLTELWKELHRYTKGALFYPTEGRSNIKWPLTHAGLVADEEQYLRRFGQDLLSDWGRDQTDVHPILVADVDEFHSALLTWLKEESLSFRPFARRLRSEQTGLTVASIAQNYLREIWATLIQEQPQEAPPTRKQQRHLRPRLWYDAELNRLNVLLVDGQWLGRPGTVQVEHDGHNQVWPTVYDPSADVTVARRVELPVHGPTWGTTVSLRVGREYMEFPLLPSPFAGERGALLFDGLTGNRTRTVLPGDSYFLLVPQAQLEADWLTQLFPEATKVGSPFRHAGYDMLQVTACPPQSLIKANSLDEINDQLIQTGAAFRLPSLEALTSPRCHLVGGLPLPAKLSPVPLYCANNPPMVVVDGAFVSGLLISLHRQLREALSYEVISTLWLPPSPESIRTLISLDQVGSEPGRYRVGLAHDLIEFQLTDEAALPTSPYRIDLSFCPGLEPVHGTEFGYHVLKDGAFVGVAWPGARLIIAVRTPHNQVDRFTQELAADKQGTFRFNLNDHYAGRLPPGPLEIWVEHRLAKSRSLRFASHSYFRSWEATWTEQGLHFTGNASFTTSGTPVVAIAFGEVPWSGQVWSSKGSVGWDGLVDLLIPAPPAKARYVAIAEGSEAPASAPWLSSRLPGVPLRANAWPLDGEGSWETWAPWMDTLHNHSAADGEVQQLASFSRLRRILEDRFGKLLAPPSGWCLPGETLAADLPLLLESSTPPRTALVDSTVLQPPASNSSLDADGPTPGIPIDPAQAQRLLTGRVPEGIRIEAAEGTWKATVVVQSEDILRPAVLVAHDYLMICRQCGRIMPRFGAEYHVRPHTHRDITCNTFLQVEPGETLAVALAVEFIPTKLAAGIAELFAYVSRHRQLPRSANRGLFEWFQQIAQHYPKGPDAPTPTRWGKEIAEAAAALTELLLYPQLRFEAARLAPLVAVYDQYPEAVIGVTARILKWAEGGSSLARTQQ